MTLAAPPLKHRLSDVLANYIAGVRAERIAVRDIVHLLGSRSSGGLLFVFALPMALPIPAPGLSILFGLPLILISVQLMVGFSYIRLPAKLMRQTISRIRFAHIVDSLLPILRRLEHVLKPRLVWMCNGYATIPIGVICVILALTITLPIPFGNVVPGLAIAMFALGLIQQDGLAILLGFGITILAAVIIWAAIAGAHTVIHLSWPLAKLGF